MLKVSHDPKMETIVSERPKKHINVIGKCSNGFDEHIICFKTSFWVMYEIYYKLEFSPRFNKTAPSNTVVLSIITKFRVSGIIL
jgi:hypothetical protein